MADPDVVHLVRPGTADPAATARQVTYQTLGDVNTAEAD
jgi:hypothetical protein